MRRCHATLPWKVVPDAKSFVCVFVFLTTPHKYSSAFYKWTAHADALHGSYCQRFPLFHARRKRPLFVDTVWRWAGRTGGNKEPRGSFLFCFSRVRIYHGYVPSIFWFQVIRDGIPQVYHCSLVPLPCVPVLLWYTLLFLCLFFSSV